jgi:transcriptional regulator with GAF, ATPase, and Fis domain
MIAAERLAEAFVEVADTLVDDFDLVEFLQMLTVRTSDLSGVSAAGLLLADQRGRLQVMAASDERSHTLELFQVQADEGPCQDCFHTGLAVVDADLAAAVDRWPTFAPRAVAAGYRAVHAFPLRLRREVIGALNLFSAEVGRIAKDDTRVVQALADVATIGLLQERAIQRGSVLAEQLQAALQSRIVIEQAKGALAQIHSVPMDHAFEMLRDYTRRNNLRLGDVARDVTGRPDRVRGLTTPNGDSGGER